VLADPLAITYNSVAKSLPRASGRIPKRPGVVGVSSMYATADGEFVAKTTNLSTKEGLTFATIELCRNVPDTDTDPFNSQDLWLPNSFGLSYVVNPFRFQTSTDIPLLRSALLAFVTSSIELRLINGEN